MASFQQSDNMTPPILPITVRFTTSIPDLLLDIPTADPTTVIALKHLIRSKLPPPTSKHRYRLIHSGKLLADDSILSSVLKILPPPPSTPDPKGKGKAIEPAPPRVYINCSIGDVLTPAELSAEALAAAASTNKNKRRTPSEGRDGQSTPQPKNTTPAPRGFERLLQGGFSAAEVNQLRLQFRSIQSSIHTPETMPSPNTLLRMEDAWIDDNGGAGGTGGGGAGQGFDFGDDSLGGGALDDLLWGNIMGFLWPLGCVGWLIREGGVWSRRRQIAVFTGFMLSLSFGILRIMS
jgi:hypothetical protein